MDYYFDANEALEKAKALIRIPGSGKQALLASNRVILLNPNNIDAYTGKAWILYCSQRNQEALEACNTAIRIQPGCAKAYTLKGKLLDRERKDKESQLAFSNALKLDPHNPRIKIARFNALRSKKKANASGNNIIQNES